MGLSGFMERRRDDERGESFMERKRIFTTGRGQTCETVGRSEARFHFMDVFQTGVSKAKQPFTHL